MQNSTYCRAAARAGGPTGRRYAIHPLAVDARRENVSGSTIRTLLLLFREKARTELRDWRPAAERQNRPANFSPAGRQDIETSWKHLAAARRPPRRPLSRTLSLHRHPRPRTRPRLPPAASVRPTALRRSNTMHVCVSSIYYIPDGFRKSKIVCKILSAQLASR